MQHAAVAQNLAEEVAKVADQLKDFELRAISAAGRGLTARADAALESRREWPPAVASRRRASPPHGSVAPTGTEPREMAAMIRTGTMAAGPVPLADALRRTRARAAA